MKGASCRLIPVFVWKRQAVAKAKRDIDEIQLDSNSNSEPHMAPKASKSDKLIKRRGCIFRGLPNEIHKGTFLGMYHCILIWVSTQQS